MNITISPGAHSGREGGCLMEIVSLIMGRHIVIEGTTTRVGWYATDKTDYPKCTAVCVARAVQTINDLLPEEDRKRTAVFIPRIMRARRAEHRPGDEESEIDRRIATRVSIWASRRVLHLVKPEHREACETVIARREASLWNDIDLFFDPIVQRPWQPDQNLAYLSCVDPTPTSSIVDAINALDAAGEDLMALLDELLDAHAKAMVEEGVALWDPSDDYPDDEEVQAVIDAILAS